MSTQPHEPTIAIRLANEEDLDALAELYTRCMTGAPGDERWTPESARRFLVMWHKRQPELFFLAEHAGRIVGGTVCDIKPYFDGSRATDGEMFIDPAVQNLGVARALMRRQIEQAHQRFGVKMVESLSNGHSPVVLEWCARLGFQRTDWVHMEVPIDRLRARLGLASEPPEPPDPAAR